MPTAQCILITATTICLDVNWENFVRGVNINEVLPIWIKGNFLDNSLFDKINNTEFKVLVIDNFNTGTIFEINELRDSWDDGFFERIKTNLTSLIPPSLNNTFKVYLYDNKTKTEDAQIVSELLTSYDYAVEFDVKVNGDVKISVWRNEFEFGTKSDYILSNAGFDEKDKKYFDGEPIVFNKNVKDFNIGITDENPYNVGAFSGKICFYKFFPKKRMN
jgi:hypothetical protein